MTNLKTLLLSGIAFAATATASCAGEYDNSGNYNGAMSNQMNAPVNSSLRDANGNLTVVNGQITSSSFAEAGGVQSFNRSSSGVGMNGSATAIGNQLNVVATGSNNIVIVSSTQINNGDQTANVNIDGQ